MCSIQSEPLTALSPVVLTKILPFHLAGKSKAGVREKKKCRFRPVDISVSLGSTGLHSALLFGHQLWVNHFWRIQWNARLREQ